MLNLQEEVFATSEAISSPLDDFGLVVHPLQHAGIEWIFGRGGISLCSFEFSAEVELWLGLNSLDKRAPSAKAKAGPALDLRQLFELFFEDMDLS